MVSRKYAIVALALCGWTLVGCAGIGTEHSVTSTSKLDGFLGNALIRIAMPDQFEDVARTLRRIGLSGQVDDFEVSINRAAERALTGLFTVASVLKPGSTMCDNHGLIWLPTRSTAWSEQRLAS